MIPALLLACGVLSWNPRTPGALESFYLLLTLVPVRRKKFSVYLLAALCGLPVSISLQEQWPGIIFLGMAQENSLRGTVKRDTVDALLVPSHAQDSCITTVEVWSGAGSTGGPINRMKLLPML